MELDQIHALHAHAFEGIMEVALGVVIGAPTGLGCEEEAPGLQGRSIYL